MRPAGLADYVDDRMSRLGEEADDRCSIVRVGGRCESEALQAYTIHAQLKTHKKSLQSSRQLREVYEEIERVHGKIKVCASCARVQCESSVDRRK